MKNRYKSTIKMEPEPSDVSASSDDDVVYGHDTAKGKRPVQEYAMMPVQKVPKTSQYKGVSRSGSFWIARLYANGYTHQIGRFDTELAAHHAYENFVVEQDQKNRLMTFVETLFRLVAETTHMSSDSKVKVMRRLHEMNTSPIDTDLIKMLQILHIGGYHTKEEFFHTVELYVK